MNVLQQQAAGLLVVGLPGTSLAEEDRRRLERLQPGGVILLPRNIEDEPQLRELVARVRQATPHSLLCLDAEGGRVDRLRKVVGPAPAGARLAAAPAQLSERAGRWVGHALSTFGFDVDFAPVVDLDHGEVENALDGRYLGATPEEVIPRARAFLRGLHDSGIGGCIKHFPGLGAAGRDTHHDASGIGLAREALERDLLPFRRLGAQAAAVMIGHASYPSIDREARPGSLSPPVGEDLLRRRLRFKGLAFSDDLEMRALDPWGDLPQRTVAALEAGCDVLLVCHSLERAEEVAAAVGDPRLAERRRQAAARLGAYRAHLATLGRRRKRFRPRDVARRLSALAAMLPGG